MTRQIHISAFGLAAAWVLCACAGTPPASEAPKPAVTAAGTAAPAGRPARSVEYGYRLVKKNGEQFYCRKEGITGSRTGSVESCMTLAQMEAARRNSQEMVREVQRTPGTMPGTDQSGGTTMGVMSQ
jgi:hypothetical protein